MCVLFSKQVVFSMYCLVLHMLAIYLVSRSGFLYVHAI